ncbi:MAG: N-acetylmannosamine-6-phosphate 2-epimerase, partial [Selenomonas bovis]|nr:N-acetylmannosamine-6-phosphate 2-epimerase [Selenomonas bovis]
PQLPGPDVALVRRLAADLAVPLFAEGRIHTPEDVRTVMAAGAFAPIIGSAITRPQLITAAFVRALEA